jgi:hypothetical protein
LFCVTLTAEGRRKLEKIVSTAPEVMSAIAALDTGTRAGDLESETLDFTTQGRSVPDTRPRRR